MSGKVSKSRRTGQSRKPLPSSTATNRRRQDLRRGYSVERLAAAQAATPQINVGNPHPVGTPEHVRYEQDVTRAIHRGIARSTMELGDMQELTAINVTKPIGSKVEAAHEGAISRPSGQLVGGMYSPQWQGPTIHKITDDFLLAQAKFKAGVPEEDIDYVHPLAWSPSEVPKPSVQHASILLATLKPTYIRNRDVRNSNIVVGTLIHEIGHHANRDRIERDPKRVNQPADQLESGMSEALAEDYRYRHAADARGNTGSAVAPSAYDKLFRQDSDKAFSYQMNRLPVPATAGRTNARAAEVAGMPTDPRLKRRMFRSTRVRP